jgi:zinc transporter ZupT
MLSSPITVGLLVFALCLGAGLAPLFARMSARVLHAVVAAASGLFLGITILHLLPELAARASAPGGRPAVLWGSVMAGLLAVLLADVLLRSREFEVEHADEPAHGDHPAHHGGHRVVGIATFLGLSVHTLGGALVIGIGFDDGALRDALVAATLAHKAAEAFSLASVLLLAELRRRTIVALLAAYAAVTPLGILAGRACSNGLDPGALGAAEGLAAGTFLYVAVGELLPEAFHGRRDRPLKILLLLAGVAASTMLRLHREGGLP